MEDMLLDSEKLFFSPINNNDEMIFKMGRFQASQGLDNRK